MSRYYGMKVTVRGYQASRKDRIAEKLQELWDFEAPDVLPDGTLELAGEDHLRAGTLDCEFAAELARTVWEANGGYCEVEVESTYLEVTPPGDIHTWNEGDYREWLAGKHLHDYTEAQVAQ